MQPPDDAHPDLIESSVKHDALGRDLRRISLGDEPGVTFAEGDRLMHNAAIAHLARRSSHSHFRRRVAWYAAAAVLALATVVIVAVLQPETPPPPTAAAVVPGDVDVSGRVDIRDAWLLAEALKHTSDGSASLSQWDLTHDGITDQRDVDALIAQIVSLSDGSGS
ncbi:MAG: dockerin type I domain-containing protein [Phycisphaerales bacterium]